MSGLHAAFARYGASGRNMRWSWSARSADGKTVVMTLWEDGLDYKQKPITYRSRAEKADRSWLDSPGGRERKENLEWAADHCAGEFRVVIVKAKDLLADPREIAEAYAQPNMLGRITSLDRDTGEFTAEITGLPASASR